MDSSSCDCDIEVEPEITDSIFTIEELTESPVCSVLEQRIDFGKVIVGTKAHKLFVFKNPFKHTRNYTVQRNPDTNPLYQMYDYTYTSKVENGQNFECKITYNPQIELETHLDYLLIFDGIVNTHKLVLRGESLGPIVQFSVNSLIFQCNPRKKLAKLTVELQNLSNVAIKYQFDVNQKQFGPFEVDKLCGDVAANHHIYFTIKFTPVKFGIYSDKLVCLILHHKPSILNLIGVLTEDLDDTRHLQLNHFPVDIAYRSGYGGYLYDSLKVRQDSPPFTLSANYLDFGSVTLDADKGSRTLVTCLTNHMSEQVKVIWAKDVTKVFCITPRVIKVPPNDSVLYECEFIPNEPDCLYCETLRGRVFWVDDRKQGAEDENQYINVPLCVNLKLLGHSFPSNKRWMSQIEMPEKVILPACVPSHWTRTTFMLRATGYLPVSFRFSPPKTSNFVVKPMIGIVKDFAIIVVQLDSDSVNKKAYIERWDVELNGFASNCLPIFIKSYCEIPCLEIGKRNVVQFESIYPGCQGFLTVQMKNLSAHHVLYQFREKPQLLQINYPSGRVAPNETILLEWTTMGKLQAPRKYTMWCEIRSIHGQVIYGQPLEIAVKVKADCSFSQLCSIPREWILNEVRTNSNYTKKILLFNFGESTIHYKIEITDKTLKFNEENLSVIPSQGTVKSMGKLPIMICLRTNQPGKFIIKITYKIRLNNTSSEIVDMNSYKIFVIKFYCQYPIIKIEDILDCNFGYLFGKMYLAEQMCITKINDTLRTIKAGEVKTLGIIMPDFEVNDKTFYAFLILRNMSKFETHLELKRNKICNCPLVEKSLGFTFRTNVYMCKHRDMLQMSLSGNVFEPNSCQKLTIRIKYLEVGPVTISYFMHLSQNRTIILNINYKVLSPTINIPSKYRMSFDLHLGTVCVCEKQSSLKTFSLYNNSANSVSYSFDVIKLNKEAERKTFKQIDILNPIGTLQPYSSYKLLFAFQPIKIQHYSYIMHVKMGQNEYKMKILGHGVAEMSSKKNRKKTAPLLIFAQKTFKPETPIMLSQSHITCDKISIWNSVEKVIFIRNISDRNIGFSFQKGCVEGCVVAKVLYSKGVLKSLESQAVRIQISSFGQPCKTRIQLPCKLLDHTQYYLHKQSVLAYNIRQEEVKNYFIITEKGTSYPENDVVIVPMAENFYRNISIDVHVVSGTDIDLHLDVDAQMKQAPHFNIHLNIDKILKQMTPPVLSINKPLSSFIIDSMTKKLQQEYKEQDLETKMPCRHVDIIKDAIQCCTMQTLKSTLFMNSLEVMQNADPGYYLQFKPSVADDEKYQDDYKRRSQFLKTTINPIPGPLLTSILNELIADSFHEVFKLGPQAKHKTDFSYKYDGKLKSKYTCRMHAENCSMDGIN